MEKRDIKSIVTRVSHESERKMNVSCLHSSLSQRWCGLAEGRFLVHFSQSCCSFSHRTGQLCWFSALSLSLRKIWNPTGFFNVLCVSGMQLQNLFFFLEPVTSLVPGRTTNCLPLAPCTLWWTKKPLVIENYAILNKRNVPVWLITTLEVQQVLFFCDAMHPGTCRCCCERDNSVFSVSIAQTEEYKASVDHKYRQHWLDNSGGFPFKVPFQTSFNTHTTINLLDVV